MIEKLKEIAEHYSISEVYIFGSRSDEIVARVAGEEPDSKHPYSDADIGIETIPGNKLTAKERVRLTIELEDLFQVPRVDLIVLSEAPPFLALEVIKGDLLYCKDRDLQAEHELLILRRAGDLAFFERRRRETIMRSDF